MTEIATAQTVHDLRHRWKPHKERLLALGGEQPALDVDPSLAGDIAQRLLDAHFPEPVHTDILDAVGLSLEPPAAERSRRDPGFRKRVLIAYEYRCAVCGYRRPNNVLSEDVLGAVVAQSRLLSFTGRLGARAWGGGGILLFWKTRMSPFPCPFPLKLKGKL